MQSLDTTIDESSCTLQNIVQIWFILLTSLYNKLHWKYNTHFALFVVFQRFALHTKDWRTRRVFLCFTSAIFKLTTSKFPAIAYNSRTVQAN